MTELPEFDRAVAIDPDGEGRWCARIEAGWDFAGTPNGGYLLSLVAKAMIELTGRPDPVAVTAHYLAPARPGPAELEALRRKGSPLLKYLAEPV